MASTCTWLYCKSSISPSLFPSSPSFFSLSLSSSQKFFVRTHTLERLRIHLDEFARSIHICIHEHDIPYCTAQKLPTETEEEREMQGDRKERGRERKREELSKLSPFSSRLSFRSWLKQSQRFSVRKKTHLWKMRLVKLSWMVRLFLSEMFQDWCAQLMPITCDSFLENAMRSFPTNDND